MSDSIFNEKKLNKIVQKQLNAAKDGSLIINGSKYEFIFDRYQGYYSVACENEWVINVNERSLNKAKRFFEKWLKS